MAYQVHMTRGAVADRDFKRATLCIVADSEAEAIAEACERLPRYVAQIATRMPLFSMTIARTLSRPKVLVVGFEGPTPPDTGRRGLGVTSRTAIAARNSALVTLQFMRQKKVANEIINTCIKLCCFLFTFISI